MPQYCPACVGVPAAARRPDREARLESTAKRLNFVDVARAYAIVLALFAHSMATFSGYSSLGDYDTLARLFIRFATPMFVFMFGIMLELVYVRRAMDTGVQGVVRRLVLRSAQCYLGYQLTVVASVLGGYLTPGEAARALVFMDTSHFGNILRFYSIALLLAIPLIRARLHWGVRVYGFLVIILWTVPMMFESALAGASFGSLDSLAGLLFGIGAAPVGPSVWHGMTFVLAGMFVGTSLTGWKSPGFQLRTFHVASAVVMAVASLIVLILARESSPIDVARNFANLRYRTQNHIGYYAVGILGSSFMLVALSRLVPLNRQLADWTRVPLALGTSSLLSFTLGNILLNLFPARAVALGEARPILASLGLILMVMALVGHPAVRRSYKNACAYPIRLRQPMWLSPTAAIGSQAGPEGRSRPQSSSDS
mgnify:CR=1 FL=1